MFRPGLLALLVWTLVFFRLQTVSSKANDITLLRDAVLAAQKPVEIPALAWTIKDAQRTVDLTRPATKVLSLLKVRNDGKEALDQFYYVIEARFSGKVAWIEAREKKASTGKYNVKMIGRDRKR